MRRMRDIREEKEKCEGGEINEKWLKIFLRAVGKERNRKKRRRN